MTHFQSMAHQALAGLALLVAGFAWAGPGAHGPNGEHLDVPAGDALPAGLRRLPDGSVQVPKATQRRLGIRTVVAPHGAHAATIALNARVVLDPRSSGLVQAPVAGQIEAPEGRLPVAGMYVKRGQVLALIRPALSASERSTHRASLAAIRASRQIAQQRVNRLVQLEGVVPRKELDAARVELQGLREQEAILSGTLDGVQQVVATTSGVVARARAMTGQMVDPQAVLFEVVDPQRILVEARVSDPAQAAQLKSATVVGMPDVALALQGVARVVQDGSVPVTFTAVAQTSVLAIGQPLTLAATLARQQTGVAVPAESVVRTPANEPMVWIKTGAERFTPQAVQTAPLGADTVLVIQGLAPDNRVVVQGASLINQIR
jgi:membrane fusion protein, heavy metal efflux system